MYFNFDDDRPDTPRIPPPLSRREVVLLTINLHAFLLIAILLFRPAGLFGKRAQ